MMTAILMFCTAVVGIALSVIDFFQSLRLVGVLYFNGDSAQSEAWQGIRRGLCEMDATRA